MRIFLAVLCLAILTACRVPKATLPIAKDDRATVIGQGIGTNAVESVAWCRPSADQVVLALSDDRKTARVVSLTNNGTVAWTAQLQYPKKNAVPALGVHDGHVAVAWMWSDDDTDSMVAQIDLLNANTGETVGKSLRRAADEDATVSLHASRLHDESILQFVLKTDTTINGRKHDAQRITVWLGADLNVARTCTAVLAGDLATWSAVYDPASNTYYACVLRDSLAKRGDTLGTKIMEVFALSEGSLRRHATTVESTVLGTRSKNIVLSTGIDNGTPVAWIEFQAENEGDLRQVTEVDLSNPSLTAKFTHAFTTEEIRRITGEDHMHAVILRDMVQTTAGRILVLERISFFSGRTSYNPGYEAVQMSMPPRDPTFMLPTTRFHSSVHSTTLDDLTGRFTTYEFYVICIDKNNKLRWTARLNRNHTDSTAYSNITTMRPSDYCFYVGAERNGHLPIVYRNSYGAAMVATSISLADGTVEKPQPILSLDKVAKLFGAHWSTPSTMHVFTSYGKADTTARISIRVE